MINGIHLHSRSSRPEFVTCFPFVELWSCFDERFQDSSRSCNDAHSHTAVSIDFDFFFVRHEHGKIVVFVFLIDYGTCSCCAHHFSSVSGMSLNVETCVPIGTSLSMRIFPSATGPGTLIFCPTTA